MFPRKIAWTSIVIVIFMFASSFHLSCYRGLYKEAKKNRKAAQEVITNSVGMDLKLIRPGSFMMGSNDAGSDEKPVHRVEITKPFYIGVYEVTQAQYGAVMGMNPSYFKGSRRPVECVSWNEAKEFCRRLSQKEGMTYRLPTEAEWEYACRAGTTTKFYWGNSVSESTVKRYAWYEKNADEDDWTTPHASEEGTQEVGRKLPNGWGLFDMSGNVWEWCEDWYGKDYYSRSPQQNPRGPYSGYYRVLRGGCWDFIAWGMLSSFRFDISPGVRSFGYGFRIVREVE